MQLYTINATPVRSTADERTNNTNISTYPQAVADILAKHEIDGFTMYEVMCYWKGEAERSFKIEIALAPSDAINIITRIAVALRDRYEQDSVMVTCPDMQSVHFV